MTTATPASDADARDTFPKLLRGLAQARASQPAYREKEYGIWQTYDWGHVARHVQDLMDRLGVPAAE